MSVSANLGHQSEADAVGRPYLNQHFSTPPTESNINFGGSSRLSASASGFQTDQTQSSRPFKKFKMHHGPQELNMTSEKMDFISSIERAADKEDPENDVYRNSAGRNSHGSSRKSPVSSTDHGASMEPGTHTGFAVKQREQSDTRENTRKNRKPVKISQGTDNEEESQSSDDAVIVKSEPQDDSVKSENQTSKSSNLFAGLDVNLKPGLHKYGSETYLSKPAFDPGIYFLLLHFVYLFFYFDFYCKIYIESTR